VVNNQLNQVKPGATRPLPFQYSNPLGTPVTNLSLCNSLNSSGGCADNPAVSAPWVSFASFAVACPSPSSAAINTATDATQFFTGNSALQNNGGANYQINWQTSRFSTKGSCANVKATFDSGLVVIPATIGFQFN